MKNFLVLAALSSLTHYSIAIACPEGDGGHGRGRGGKKMIEKLDTNKDAQLSREEAKGKARILDKFDEIDSNRDGQLTEVELKAHHDARRPPKAVDAPAE